MPPTMRWFRCYINLKDFWFCEEPWMQRTLSKNLRDEKGIYWYLNVYFSWPFNLAPFTPPRWFGEGAIFRLFRGHWLLPVAFFLALTQLTSLSLKPPILAVTYFGSGSCLSLNPRAFRRRVRKYGLFEVIKRYKTFVLVLKRRGHYGNGKNWWCFFWHKEG